MDIAAACEPVVHNHDCDDRCDKAKIGPEEGKEVLGAVHQKPWDDGPHEYVAEDHAADDGEVLGKEAVKVTANGNSVAGDVCDDRSKALNEGS